MISCITNFAAGFQEELNHEEVVEVTERVKGDFKGLLKAILLNSNPMKVRLQSLPYGLRLLLATLSLGIGTGLVGIACHYLLEGVQDWPLAKLVPIYPSIPRS